MNNSANNNHSVTKKSLRLHSNSIRLLVLATVALCFAGCTSVPPEAWERGRFAKLEMQFEPDAMNAAFMRHTYASKEASSGGSSTAGGGCGCN